MKPIKPVYIERSNKQEKIAGLVFLLIIALVLACAGVLSAQPANGNVLKASAQKTVDQATITWNVAADSKYPFFLIERTQDKQHYEIVSVVKNTGNSNSTSMFTATDYNPLAGNTYYRISEMDAKGKTVHLFEVTFTGNAQQLTQK